MKIKNLPAWLKGGLISLFILIIYVIIILLTNWFFGGITSFASNTGKIIFIIVLPFVNLITSFYLPHERYGIGILVGLIGVYILTPIFYFLVGALIGWIVGKIKKRK